MIEEAFRRIRHLLSALLVVLGGFLAAAFLTLDLIGVQKIAAPLIDLDTRLVALFFMLASVLTAAGKLAEARLQIEDLTGEERTYKDAPLIGWTDLQVQFNEDRSIYVSVWCENSGPSESVATYVQFHSWSSQPNDDVAIIGELDLWHPIKAHKLGPEHKFLIPLLSKPGLASGRREISWLMVYSDRARPDVVYLTQASFQADFNTPGSVKPIVGTVFLDATSTPKVRRRRYVDRVAESTR